jgi:hypothetical protein
MLLRKVLPTGALSAGRRAYMLGFTYDDDEAR